MQFLFWPSATILNGMFLPLRDPGPQLPDGDLSELDLFRLYITDEVVEHFVEATNEYAEAQKAAKPAMYL